MASERAMVLGFCGSKRARPRFSAVENGEQPVACAPKKRTGFPSTHPRGMRSRKALAIFPISEPPAMGATKLSGKRQPSRSAISQPCGCDDAVFEGERREAHGVVLEVKILDAPMFRELARGHQRRAADSGRRRVAFRQRQKLRIAPHVEGAAGKSFAPDLFLERVVVERDFQRRKTIFAERTRGIAPGLAALFTS